jgi:hypothetical protein
MLVNRRTFNVKQMDEAVAFIKAEVKRFSGYTGPVRIYTPETGSFGVVAVEWEYDSLEEYGKLWAEYYATPETPAAMEKWDELTRPGGTNELWWRVD